MVVTDIPSVDIVLTKYPKEKFDLEKWMRRCKAISSERFYAFVMDSFNTRSGSLFSYEGVKKQMADESAEHIFVMEYWPKGKYDGDETYLPKKEEEEDV